MINQMARVDSFKAILVACCVLLLSACGGGGGGDGDSATSETVSSVVSGSVGDGPITGATVKIYNSRGKLVSTEVSDNTASYKSSLKLRRSEYPLILKVSDGIDLVTGEAPDFEMVSVIIKPQSPTANINPFSTLIIKMAESMPGGVNAENVRYTTSVVMDKFSFGLDPQVIDNPITKKITNGNIAHIVKASEALGEMVRRTRDRVTASGRPLSGDEVVAAIVADMADGFLDGMGAVGSDPTISAVVNVVTGQVLVEAMTNTLRVNGVVATGVIDQAIKTTHPKTRKSHMSDSVLLTSGLLDQAALSVAAARVVDTSSRLSRLAEDIDSLSAGESASNADKVIDSEATHWLSDAVTATTTADTEDVVVINLVASNTPVPDAGADEPVAGTDPDAGGTDPVDEPVADSDPDTGGTDPADEPVADSDPDAGGTDPAEEPVASNTTPVIQGSPAGSVVASNNYSFNPSASDPDGDALSFSISNKPGWASFNNSTGGLTGTPADGDVGTYKDIVISVSDGTDSTSLSAFSIEVKASVATTGVMDLSWTAPVTRTDGTPLSLADISGYRIYYGTTAGQYTDSADITDGTAQSAQVTDVPVGSYHVVMTTYDVNGVESDYSASVIKSIQ